jgi:hypothetical protein
MFNQWLSMIMPREKGEIMSEYFWEQAEKQ